MNAPHPITPAFDVAEGAYIVTIDDFPEGCFVRVVNGKRFGTGENKLGLTVTLPLDTLLCNGCDAPLDNGACGDCCLVYLDVRQSSDGWARVVA